MKFDNYLAAAGILLLAGTAIATAQQPTPPLEVPCPNDEPCVLLILTKTEINVLTAETGILATAAQARNLDLGQYVAYFRQKIALAPAGKNAPKTPTDVHSLNGVTGDSAVTGKITPQEAPKKP